MSSRNRAPLKRVMCMRELSIFYSIDPQISYLKYIFYNLQSDSTHVFTLSSQQLSKARNAEVLILVLGEARDK